MHDPLREHISDESSEANPGAAHRHVMPAALRRFRLAPLKLWFTDRAHCPQPFRDRWLCAYGPTRRPGTLLCAKVRTVQLPTLHIAMTRCVREPRDGSKYISAM